MRIGIIQHKSLPSVEQTRLSLASRVEEAAKGGASLVVLPELHDTPYFCQREDVDRFALAEPIPGPATEFYSSLAKRTGVVLVTSLFERRSVGLYHNTAAVFDSDGHLAGIYRKSHIPDDPGYHEKFYFTPGDTGFHPIPTSVGRLGVQVCWDQWYPEGARLMALRGADLLIYPTAIGYDLRDTPEEQERQRQAWITVQRGHAVANGLPLVAVNRVGSEPEPGERHGGIAFWGTSFVCGQQGELLYEASQEGEETALVDVDLTHTETVRRWWPFLRDRRIDAYEGLDSRWLS